MTPTSTAPLDDRPRRQDAEDNRSRILEVAVTVLAERPGASIADIAAAAGVARRTVYGHFPTRENLIASLAGDSQAELVEIVAEADELGATPEERYARFLLGAWRMPARRGVLLAIGRAELGPDGVREVMAPINARVARNVAQAQAAGTFDDRLPPTALARVLQTVNFALLDAVLAGEWDGDAQTATVSCLLTAGMTRAKAQQLTRRVARALG